MALISKGFQKFQKGKIPIFLDSGASDTMFVSKDVFINYKSITPHTGDLAKAEKRLMLIQFKSPLLWLVS